MNCLTESFIFLLCLNISAISFTIKKIIISANHLNVVKYKYIGGRMGKAISVAIREKSDSGDRHIFNKNLESYFNDKMKNTNVPLLANFSSYFESLPVRCYDHEFIKLHNVNYYARSKDLNEMARSIINLGVSKKEARYIAAAPNSGKTSAVLYAFLSSTTIENGGTHYLYIPFNNNYHRTFHMMFTPSPDSIIAIKQGAAFIFECVKVLLERPDDIDSYDIKIENSPKMSMEEISESISKYLDEKLGENSRVWFHADQHRKISSRYEERETKAFALGVMETLARVRRAKVITTGTDRPEFIPAVTGADIGRIPISLPAFDIDQIMANIDELSIDPSNFNKIQQRLFARLKINLGFKLSEMDNIAILHRPESCSDSTKFLKKFKKAKSGPNALEKCISLCEFTISKDTNSIFRNDDIAPQLLLGMTDRDFEKRHLEGVLSMQDGLITANILMLLNYYDGYDNNKVFNLGQEIFKGSINAYGKAIIATPIEAAYYWTLSCRSALDGEIKFNNDGVSFSIECKNLKPARLFPDEYDTNYDVNFLEHDVMYYVEKTTGVPSHPVGDLFFISKNNELVLVDITGGDDKEMLEKKKKLMDWIDREQENNLKYTLRGVVVALNVDDKCETGVVSIVSGEAAARLLGGLRQIAGWLQ